MNLFAKYGHKMDKNRYFKAPDSVLQIISEALVKFKGKKNDGK